MKYIKGMIVVALSKLLTFLFQNSLPKVFKIAYLIFSKQVTKSFQNCLTLTILTYREYANHNNLYYDY